ncbi:hypothetical protein V8B97DRAFT_2023444 [Scleroderma yunnanense]
MTLEEKQVLMALCERQTNSLLQSELLGNNTSDFGDNFGAFNNILSGTHPLKISHTGGEFQELARQVLNAMHTNLILDHRPFISHQSCRDYQSHRDHTQLHAITFEQQIPAAAKVYLIWSFNHSHTDSCTGQVMLNVIDVFWTDQFDFLILSTDPYILPVVVAFQPYISHQFTIVFNQYLQILQYVQHMTLTMICCIGPLWHLKNACPACTYTLQGKPELKFSLLYTMNGNDSLKHAIMQCPSKCEELLLGQVLACDWYLTQEEVDVFAKDHQVDIDMLTEGNEDNPCAGCWKNMKDQHTTRMWSVFDQTGIFMVYPLAVVPRLLNTFGKELGGEYDIGCKFKTILCRSSLGECAWLLTHRPLFRSFHGHAHSHLCQLNHLTTYVEGLGLEDLDGCECTFSKSNHNIYANLSMFLHNNYKQALTILRETQEHLLQLKHELSITENSVFHAWLAEEQAYLLSQRKEPKEETAPMTYWQRLINLTASREHLTATESWSVITSKTAMCNLRCDAISTTRLETVQHHTQENYDKDFAAVQESELKLEITSHWKPGDVEWQNAGSLVAQCKYQHTLNNLESLVVAHISLSPPQHTLTLEEVVEYTFLSDFQLLQDTCKDISQCPWASPTAHLALDMYFKMLEITTLPGFLGTLEPGKSMNVDAGAPAGPITIVPPSFITTYPLLEVPLEEDTPNDLDEEQEEEEALVECTHTLEDVLSITA